MPWRLVTFLIVLTIVVLFAGFNITNVADISFGFYTLKNVPVFVSLFVAFLFGTFLVLPFAVRKRKAKAMPEKSRETKQNATDIQAEEAIPEPEPTPVPPKKKRGKK
jgi:uncharacterized integral membrane protein